MGPIFTTSGHANPVLTLIALSIRLADKINANIHKNIYRLYFG